MFGMNEKKDTEIDGKKKKKRKGINTFLVPTFWTISRFDP